MSQVGTIQFNKGMSTDIDKSFRDGTSYINAENFTLSSIDGGTSGALENVKGNELVSSITFATNHEIVGYVNVVEDVVYFTTDGTDSNIYLYSGGVLTPIYSDSESTSKLNFDKTDSNNRIIGVGRQETQAIKKVYWVDGVNELRYLDLNRSYSGKEATVFNTVPPMDVTSTIEAEVMNGSGSYKAGTVYHAYQFYTKNGASSTIGNFSFPSKLSEYSNVKDGGTNKDEDSGCSVKVTISNISDDILGLYDRIRIYSIFYDNNISPVINVTDELPLSFNTVSILDNGSVISEITNSEFADLKQTTYTPKTIESKNNYLFIGNLTETTFTSDAIDNWDARAYRFAGSGNYTYINSADGSSTIRVYGANGTTPFKIDAGSSTYPGVSEGDDVPIEFDCVNDYNEVYGNSLSARTSYATGGYKHIADGSEIGGEGLNIKYTFEEFRKVIDYTGDVSNYPGNKAVDSNLSDEANLGYTTTTYNVIECESGEVYRVGIRFFNEKGQSSFVKWIGDILWEESFFYYGNERKVSYDSITDETTNLMGVLKVELKNTDLFTADPSIKSWQVVRVKREDVDKTVKANGLLTPVIKDGDYYRPPVDAHRTGCTTTYYNESRAANYTNGQHSLHEFKFISPETMFNSKGDVQLEGTKIRVYNALFDDDTYSSRLVATVTGVLTNTHIAKTDKILELDSITGMRSNLYNIIDSTYLEPVYPDESTTSKKTIGDISILNQTDYNLDNLYYAAANSSPAIAIDPSEFIDSDLVATDAYFYASILTNNDHTRYGGETYYDRLNNEYISFSDRQPTNVTSTYCVYGDTYTNMFYYMANMLDDGKVGPDQSLQNLHCFPVQSTIDTRYRQDRILDYYAGPAEFLSGDNINMIQETVEKGIELHDVSYNTDLGDLYIYNTAYSSENNSTPSFQKPFDFDEVTTLTTKVLASEKKINGETKDNWTNFLSNNFIEVDASYGELNNLKTMDNHLFYWQDKAFGTLAVNDRSLIKDESGTQLALGTGGVLERYDYISNEVGNKDKYNITSTDNALFWNYSDRKQLYRYNGNLEEISFSKAISNHVLNEDVILPISITDHTNKEVLFRVGNDILVFDTILDVFSGVYTFTPKWLIPLFNGSYMSSDDSKAVYLHNSDAVNKGNFYGTDNDSTIKHIFVGDYYSTKVFDTLNWHSTSTNSGVNQYDDTFDEYRIYNDYQNTDWQNISWKRRERSFSTIVPRDVVNQLQSANKDIFNAVNLDETQLFKRRIRDKYMILDLKYDNTNGNTFSVPSMQIGYRSSIR